MLMFSCIDCKLPQDALTTSGRCTGCGSSAVSLIDVAQPNRELIRERYSLPDFLVEWAAKEEEQRSRQNGNQV